MIRQMSSHTVSFKVVIVSIKLLVLVCEREESNGSVIM